MLRMAPVLAVSLLLLGPLGFGEARAQGPAQPTLEQAMQASPEGLALGYLLIRYHQGMLDLVRKGLKLTTSLDGEAAQIDSSNVEVWADGLQKRLDTYAAAIRQRGFAHVAGEYRARKGGSCIYATSDSVTLLQDEFAVHMTVRPVPGERNLVIEGVTVESVLVFEDPLNPERHLSGTPAKRGIKLDDLGGGCKVELASR